MQRKQPSRSSSSIGDYSLGRKIQSDDPMPLMPDKFKLSGSYPIKKEHTFPAFAKLDLKTSAIESKSHFDFKLSLGTNSIASAPYQYDFPKPKSTGEKVLKAVKIGCSTLATKVALETASTLIPPAPIGQVAFALNVSNRMADSSKQKKDFVCAVVGAGAEILTSQVGDRAVVSGVVTMVGATGGLGLVAAPPVLVGGLMVVDTVSRYTGDFAQKGCLSLFDLSKNSASPPTSIDTSALTPFSPRLF